MIEEIKEILQTLDGIASGDWIQMLPKEANKLLDYIINLQHIEEQHKKLNGELRKENKKLQSRIYKVVEYLKYQLDNLDFEKDTKAKMLCVMVLVMLDKEELKESGNNE